MQSVTYRGRRSAQIENSLLRVTITAEGGHVAEICHKQSGVNPLWTPPWPSIEPSVYDPVRHPEYGGHNESQLLAGIMGHSICLDTFGAPSAEEAAAGMPVHGEAPVAAYKINGGSDWVDLEAQRTRLRAAIQKRNSLALQVARLTPRPFCACSLEATLPKAQLRFKRRISLTPDSMVLAFSETLENLSPTDRPIGWTQHVTLGPPFLEPGHTQFRASATRSKVIESDFNGGNGSQRQAAEFDWPLCPLKNGQTSDLRVFTSEPVSGGFTSHLMNPDEEHAWFTAWSPSANLLLGYVWKRSDFPWLSRWEENHLRTQPPWNGNGLACGMEFGVSPFVESRREMVNRGNLFGAPTFRWAPAQSSLQLNYCAFLTFRDSIPEAIGWDGGSKITFAKLRANRAQNPPDAKSS